ncbi:MAG: hypothetical protein QNJ55_13105 [Xenococcus sp. MO_188.B8]|nr:hypothetical protein [Xenococcus sp. MO_188.B8]
MTDNTTTLPTGSQSKLRDIVSSQLQILLEHKNYDGAKALLIPVQPVDIAEAIRHSLALRGLPKAGAARSQCCQSPYKRSRFGY